MKTSNNTHGYIQATIDFSVGPKPMNVLGYYARTLNDKRWVNTTRVITLMSNQRSICCSLRRDFRLVIGDPNHPGKAIANPVVWLKTNVITEVKPWLIPPLNPYVSALSFKAQTPTTTVYSLTIVNPTIGWLGFFIQANFPGPDGTALELTTNTQIIPDTYPTNDCHGDECRGTLV